MVVLYGTNTYQLVALVESKVNNPVVESSVPFK